MILFKEIENIKNEHILRIREQPDDIVFSVRSPAGNTRRIWYSDIRSCIEDVKDYETRYSLAKEELENFGRLGVQARREIYGRISQSPKRRLELKREMERCRDEIEKYGKLGDFFTQKVEDFLSGAITEYNKPVSQNQSGTKEKREQWRGLKMEFGSKIQEIYKTDRNQEPGKQNYRSLKDATEQLYRSYKFPKRWKWTLLKCYNCARSAG